MKFAARPNAPVLDSYWMPFTSNRQFKAAPRLLASAAGINYIAADGKTVLDGTAGLWCVNAGHGRERIADAVYRQLREMDYAPSFQMGHPIVFEYAEMLAKNAPGGPEAGLDRVFFTGSGSESVETALKIAIAYQRSMAYTNAIATSHHLEQMRSDLARKNEDLDRAVALDRKSVV